MRLGILGGSFNPVHHGHLILAERAAEAARLDRVLLVPTALSPLKSPGEVAPAADRLAWVRAAVRGNARLAACDLEVRRGGVSYTVDTLRELARRHPEARLHLILGADASELLPKWKSIDEVARLATFLFLARPGHRIRARMPKQRILAAPLLEISSTEIRDRLRRGRSIRYLVPEAVRLRLERRNPYGGDSSLSTFSRSAEKAARLKSLLP
jgi:nicotinate-nucleotide adenylyltransferase